MTKTEEVTTTNETTRVKAPLVCSQRLFLAVLIFFGYFLCYAHRNGIAVSIVCMVNPDVDKVPTHTNQSVNTSRNIPASCHKHTVEATRSVSQVLLWPKETRGVILGSFYWGYALTQILASVIVNLIGPKLFLALVVSISSLSTLMIPLIAKYHPSGVVVLRVLTGAAQGGLWPAGFRFWSTWAPASERTTLLSLPASGPSMGTILSLIMGGLFCLFSFNDIIPFPFRYGWAWFFYLLGGLGIIWTFLWLTFASDTPANNRFVSDREKEYIRACKAEEKIQDTKTKIPWIPLLRSQGFWCILISMFFCDFGFYAIWAVVPEYMNEVLLFSIEENGLLSALPHLISFIVVIATGGLADFIIQNGYLKRVTTRKLFHGVGAIGPAICLLLMSFLDCQHRYLAVFLLTFGVGLSGLMMSGGYVVNVSDFSGIHSGVVFGVSNTISSIGGFCAPYITSIITKHKTATQWRIAFILYATSFFLSAVAFSLLARAETEKWARDDAHDEQINKDEGAAEELMKIESTNPVA